MLVLARKKNETILVGEGIEITVLKIKGNTVRLGVNAPGDVKILRGELSPFEVQFRAESDVEIESDESPSKDEGSMNPIAQAG